MSGVPNESQRAMVGARIKPLFEEEARERQLAGLAQYQDSVQANWPERENRQARDDAAAAAHVSARSVEIWTRLACGRCPYRWEHPGPPEPGDLDRVCGVCGSPLGAVTVFRVGTVFEMGGEGWTNPRQR